MDKLLSLCMIVKNEEKVLERCLNSARSFVDEIIIVDTGSTDRTKEIALSFTNHVYDFVWINDFAIAKNDAVRRATSKWVLVLDADEYLDPDQAPELRTYLSDQDATKPLGFTLPIFNCIESVKSGKFIESSAVRLFSNLPTIYFERPIHEQVVYRDGELPLRNYSLSIFHTGYLQETREEKEKSSRNLNIFKNLKGRLEEYDYFTLGNEYSSIRDYKKALYYYERALTKKIETMSIFPYCRYQIVLVLIELKRYKDALAYIEDNLVRWPQFPDYYSLKAIIYETLGLEQEAIQLNLTALKKADAPSGKQDRFWLITPSLGGQIPLSNLANLYQRNYDYNQAVYHLAKLVNMNANDHLVLFKLLNILVQHEAVESILEFLRKIFDFERSDHLVKLLHVSLLLGNKELSQFFYDECLSKQLSLQPQQQLYFAILFHDEERFNRYLAESVTSNVTGQRNKLLFLASILWNNSDYSAELSQSQDESDPSLPLLQNMHATLFEQNLEIEGRPFDINYIATILIDLFKMGYFDEYDRLVQRYPSYNYVLANIMGDYFYQHGQMQLAVDYYGLLLAGNQLSGPGYYNLAKLYIYQGDIEQGLQFLHSAIDRCPDQASWYIQYILISPQSPERAEIANKYRDNFYQYSSIEIVDQKIKGQA